MYISTLQQLADILTKALGEQQFSKLRQNMGLRSKQGLSGISKLGIAVGMMLCISSISLSENHSVLKEITLVYDNPCDTLKMTTDGNFRARAFNDSNTRCWCSTLEQYLLSECIKIYEKSWLPILSNISTCMHPKYKRGIGTEIVRQ